MKSDKEKRLENLHLSRENFWVHLSFNQLVGRSTESPGAIQNSFS